MDSYLSMNMMGFFSVLSVYSVVNPFSLLKNLRKSAYIPSYTLKASQGKLWLKKQNLSPIYFVSFVLFVVPKKNQFLAS